MPGCLSFAHTLVREALYKTLPARQRSSLHRRAGEALERRPAVANAAELAHHFLRAGDYVKAASYADAAGREALTVLAYEEAVVHFERALAALAQAPGEEARRVDLLLALGDARLRTGDVRAARVAFDEAAAEARRRGRADQLAQAALGFGAGLGGFEVTLFDQHQITLLEEALRALGPEDSRLRAWTLARLSVALSFVAPQPRRHELSEAAVDMARRLGDLRALAYALACHCDALAGPAHTEQRRRAADEIIGLADQEQDAAAALLGRRLRVVALLELADIAGVDAEIESFSRAAEDLRQPLYLWYVPLWRGMRALMQGRLEDAERHVAHAASDGARASSANARILTDSLRIELALAQGQPHEAEALLRSDVEAGLSLGPSAQAALASILARQGRRYEAQAIVDRLTMGGLEELPVEDGQWLNAMCRLAEAAANLRDVDAAEALYRRLAPHADRFAVDGIGAACLGSVHRFLGLLADTLGQADACVAHFDRAVVAHRRTGSSLLLAQTLRQRGDAEADALYAGLGLGDRWPRPVRDDRAKANVFRRDGESWVLAFAGREVSVPDGKGLRDIAVLLAAPGRAVPVADLVALDGGAVPRPAGGAEILDASARAAYRARLIDLREELEEAERFRDLERSSRAKLEIDALTEQLTRAIGLRGRPRQGDDAAERARKAITRRIRHAINRLASRHPELAAHLEHSIRTGRFCSYSPEHPVTWLL
jgi:tetratricopeptide (TPR) repeat protein